MLPLEWGNSNYRTFLRWSRLVALPLAVLLGAPYGVAQSSGRCSILKGEHVSRELVTLNIRAKRSKHGTRAPVEVTITLTAGSKGVYLPDYFGDFMKTCERGFSAILLAPSGKTADRTPTGCARGAGQGYSWPGFRTPEAELVNFVRLNPGEVRTWRTTLETSAVSRGRYCLYGEYLSYAYYIDEVSRLQKVSGLMAKGRITATPLPIDLR